MKKTYQVISPLLFLSILCFFACSKSDNEKNNAYDPYNIEAPKNVLVVLGNGFNDSYYVNSFNEAILSAYIPPPSKKTKDPIPANRVVSFVEVLVFPDDFGGGNLGRISSLPEMIDERDIDSLIILGAPDGTFRPLAKMQDSTLDYSIISIFPQDNILAHIADSDLVLDFVQAEQTSEEPILEEENIFIDNFKVTQTVIELIHYIQKNGKFDLKPDELKAQIQETVNSVWTIDFYTDPENGIRAENCFVLDTIAKEESKEQ